MHRWFAETFTANITSWWLGITQSLNNGMKESSLYGVYVLILKTCALKTRDVLAVLWIVEILTETLKLKKIDFVQS